MWIMVYKLEATNLCAQRLTSSMPMHPLPVLLNNGVPVALCCDDPSVFVNMGLTFDYFQVRIMCGKI
jgi:adenosine deaminase